MMRSPTAPVMHRPSRRSRLGNHTDTITRRDHRISSSSSQMRHADAITGRDRVDLGVGVVREWCGRRQGRRFRVSLARPGGHARVPLLGGEEEVGLAGGVGGLFAAEEGVVGCFFFGLGDGGFGGGVEVGGL